MDEDDPKEDGGKTDANSEADAAEFHLELLPTIEWNGDFLYFGYFDVTDAVDELGNLYGDGIVRPNGEGVVQQMTIPPSPGECVGIEKKRGGGIVCQRENGNGITIRDKSGVKNGVVNNDAVGGANFDRDVLGATTGKEGQEEEEKSEGGHFFELKIEN